MKSATLPKLETSLRPMPSVSKEAESPDSSPFGSPKDLDKIFGKPNGRGPDFDPNLGKIIDTLNKEYPTVFYKELDYSIYTQNIQVEDPTGVQFQGLKTYKQLFGLLRFFRNFAMKGAEVKHTLVYDWMKQQVKVTWFCRVWIKGQQDPIHVDGVSVYSVNDQGFVYKHHIEKIVVNGTPAIPPYGIRWLNIKELLNVRAKKDAFPRGIPMPTPIGTGLKLDAATVDLRALAMTGAEASSGEEGAAAAAARPAAASGAALAMTGAEASSGEGAAAAAARPAAASGEAAAGGEDEAAAAPKNEKKKGGFKWPELPKLKLGGCESDSDCDSPKVCCDLMGLKVCCSGGMGVENREYGGYAPQLIPIPIPVEADDPYARVPGGGYGNGGGGGYGGGYGRY
eukprot:CAMPEP_0194603420 /NCGR_PEP_ID=MMETSP0292-20121207/30234_1 /TAXON_ID=39354 /ORGANISM="Heterosigma akashiwo, Strain CCMP2393" /LENGTH=396 /DNA_ID=CAMNT_0039465849 /DNA_START=203 /DNA_END=1394 /DNA_ORIENTATION=+